MANPFDDAFRAALGNRNSIDTSNTTNTNIASRVDDMLNWRLTSDLPTQDEIVGTSNAVQMGVDRRNRVGNKSDWVANQINAFGSGLINIAGEIGAAGVGLVSPETGKFLSDKLQEFNEFSHDQYHVDTRRSLDRVNRLNQLIEEQAAYDYQQDIDKGKSSLSAGAKRYGKTFLNAAKNLVTDPNAASQSVSSGLASLVPFGAAGRATGAISRGMKLRRGSKLGVEASKLTDSLLERAVAASGVVGSMGVSGASSAYIEASDFVMNKSFQDLYKDSEVFQDMVDNQGLTPRQAQIKIARQTGLIAARNVGPLYGAAGLIARRFTENPLKQVTRGSALKTTLVQEPLENIIQDTVAPLGTGLAKQKVDSSVDPLLNVGTSAGSSAVTGIGMAGTLKAPSLAAGQLNKLVDKNKARIDRNSEKRSVKAATDFITQFSKSIQEQNESNQDLESSNINKYIQDIRNNPNYTDEQKSKFEDDLNSIKEQFRLPENESLFDGISESAIPEASENESLPETLINIAKKVIDPKVSNEDKIKLAQVFDSLFEPLANAVQSEQFQNLSKEFEEFKEQGVAIFGALQLLNNSEEFKAYSDVLQQALGETTDNIEVTPDSLDRILLAAKFAPEKLSHQVVEEALKLPNLTNNQKELLETLKNFVINKEGKFSSVAAQKLFRTNKDNLFKGYLSLKGYWARTIQARQVGDVTTEAELQRALGNFIKAQQNKIDALITSRKTGEPKSYQTISPKHARMRKSKSTINWEGGKSQGFLNQLKAEQDALEAVYGALFDPKESQATQGTTEAVKPQETPKITSKAKPHIVPKKKQAPISQPKATKPKARVAETKTKNTNSKSPLSNEVKRLVEKMDDFVKRIDSSTNEDEIPSFKAISKDITKALDRTEKLLSRMQSFGTDKAKQLWEQLETVKNLDISKSEDYGQTVEDIKTFLNDVYSYAREYAKRQGDLFYDSKVKTKSSKSLDDQKSINENSTDFDPSKDDGTSPSNFTLKTKSNLPKHIQDKDKAKSSKASQFIGNGVTGSSTALYRRQWSEIGRANTGKYTPQSKVFISVNGGQNGKTDFQSIKSLIEKAAQAGVTFITDTPKYISNSGYNTGEKEVAVFLKTLGYSVSEDGIWTNKPTAQVLEETLSLNIKKVSDIDAPTKLNLREVNDEEESTEPLKEIEVEPVEDTTTEQESYESILTEDQQERAKLSFKKVLSALPSWDGKNSLFSKVFDVTGSALTRFDSPVEVLSRALQHKNFNGALSEIFGKEVKLTKEDKNLFAQFFVNSIKKGDQNRITKHSSLLLGYLENSLGGLTIYERLVNQLNGGSEGIMEPSKKKQLNTTLAALVQLDPNDKNKLIVNPTILQITLLAVSSTIAKSSNNAITIKASDSYIRGSLDLPSDVPINDSLARLVSLGKRKEQLVDDSLDLVKRMLGVKNAKNVSTNYGDAILKSLIANIVSFDLGTKKRQRKLLLNPDDVTSSDVYIPIAFTVNKNTGEVGKINEDNIHKFFSERDDSSQTTYNLIYAVNPKYKENLKGVKVLDKLLDIKDTKPYYIGSEEINHSVNEHRTRNRLSKRKQESIRNLDNVVFNINSGLFNYYDELSLEGLLESSNLNYTEEELKNLPESFALKVAGQKLSLTNEYYAVKSLIEDLRAYSEESGIPIYDIPIRYKNESITTNRVMMSGGYTPQSSKLIRELVSLKRYRLDLTDPKQLYNWQKTILQMEDDLLKPDKHTNRSAVSEAFSDLVDKYNPLIASMESPEQFKKALLAWGSPVPDNLIHALRDVHRYLKTDDKKHFITRVALESDGKTNGPAGAFMTLLNNITSDNIEKIITTMNKIGLFVKEPGNEFRTVNEYQAYDDVDLYGSSAADLSETVKSGIIRYKDIDRELTSGDKRLGAFYADNNERVVRALKETFGENKVNISLDDNGALQVSINRGITKNPMTITVYGSGVKGMGAKLVSDLLEGNSASGVQGLYDYIAEYILNKDKESFNKQESIERINNIVDSINMLLSEFTVNRDDDIELIIGQLNPLSFDPDNPLNFKVPPFHRVILDKNMTLFMENMQDSVFNAMDQSVREGRDVLIQTSQIISRAAADLFAKEYTKLLNSHKKKHGENFNVLEHGITREDIQEILKKIDHTLMPYSTGDQRWFIGNNIVDELNDTVIAYSQMQANNDLVTINSRGRTPTLSDNIGVRILPYLVIGMGDAGMVMRATTGPNALEQVMQAFDGLYIPVDRMEEYGRLINKAMVEAWLESNPYEVSLRNLKRLEELMGVVYLDSLLTDKDRFEYIEIITKLNAFSESVDNFHTAVNETGFFSDQMGATESPYEKEGKGTLLENYNKAKQQKEKENNEEPDILNTISPDKEVTVLNAVSFVDSLIKAIGKKGDKDYLKILRTIRRNPDSVSKFQVVVGTREDINNKFNANIQQGELGRFDLSDRRLYIASGSLETSVHDLIHASTIVALADGLSNGSGDARIASLRDLVQEYIDNPLDTSVITNPDIATAYTNLRNTLNKYLGDPDTLISSLPISNQAAIINEVMAWGLSNKHLRTEGKTRFLSKVLRAVINTINDIFPGLLPSARSSFFDHLIFHTNLLITEQGRLLENDTNSEPYSKAKEIIKAPLQHYTSPSEDSRLNDITERFVRKLDSFINNTPDTPWSNKKHRLIEANIQEANVQAIVGNAQAVGFLQDPKEVTTYTNVVVPLLVGDTSNTVANIETQELYDKVLSELSYEDFMPENGSQLDERLAKEKYEFIKNAGMTSSTPLKGFNGESVRLASFVGLALVDPKLRKVIDSIKIDRKKYPNGNILQTLSNTYDKALDAIYNKLSTGRYAKEGIESAQDAMDLTTSILTKTATDSSNLLTTSLSYVNTVLDKANDITKSTIATLAGGVTGSLRSTTESDNALRSGLANSLTVMVNTLTESGHKANAEALITLSRQPWIPDAVKHLLLDLTGRTDSNGATYDLIKKTMDKVQRSRQFFKEVMPEVLVDSFKDKPTEEDQKSMYQGFAKADMASFIVNDFNEVEELFRSSKARKQKTKELEDKLTKEQKQKSKELAEYMMMGKVSNFLLRNADAIHYFISGSASVEDIDQLTSLYAYEMLSQKEKENISRLISKEPDATRKILGILRSTKNVSNNKSKDNNGRFNALKGYIASVNATGESVSVQDNDSRKYLESRGYVYLGDYEGNDLLETNKGYYFSPIKQRSNFHQGIIQTTRISVGGVDTTTGMSIDNNHAGFITSEPVVKRISQNIRNNTGANPVIPVFDNKGEVIGYQLSVDPSMYSKAPGSTNITNMIGYTLGRTIEEESAQEMNKESIKQAVKDFKADPDLDKYTNILDPKFLRDPVNRDAVRLIPEDVIQDAQKEFGKDKFWIRTDLVTDMIGYRTPSVRDFYNGTSRWSPKHRKAVRRALEAVLGKDAIVLATKGEEVLSDLVHTAKELIIIKSVIIPTINLTADITQLMTRGVPLGVILKGLNEKRIEADYYFKSEIQKAKLNTEALTELNLKKRDIYRARIKSIEDAQKRLSIWPLIEAGEFTSISRVDVNKDDLLLSKGRLKDYIEKKVENVPEPILNASRYALMARDTRIFQLLEKATEYGDFISKAILYDHMISKGMTKEDALGVASDEFINYNRHAGRWREGLEKFGLLWFYNYKLRITKVAANMIATDPLRVVLMNTFLPNTSLFDTPIRENIFSKMIDGVLPYSIGPSMGIGSYKFTPIGQIMN